MKILLLFLTSTVSLLAAQFQDPLKVSHSLSNWPLVLKFSPQDTSEGLWKNPMNKLTIQRPESVLGQIEFPGGLVNMEPRSVNAVFDAGSSSDEDQLRG